MILLLFNQQAGGVVIVQVVPMPTQVMTVTITPLEWLVSMGGGWSVSDSGEWPTEAGSGWAATNSTSWGVSEGSQWEGR